MGPDVQVSVDRIFLVLIYPQKLLSLHLKLSYILKIESKFPADNGVSVKLSENNCSSVSSEILVFAGYFQGIIITHIHIFDIISNAF